MKLVFNILHNGKKQVYTKKCIKEIYLLNMGPHDLMLNIMVIFIFSGHLTKTEVYLSNNRPNINYLYLPICTSKALEIFAILTNRQYILYRQDQ